MATNRLTIPIVAFVAALVGLVAVRVGSDGEPDDSDGAPATEQSAPGGLRFTDVTKAAGLDEVHSRTDLTGESAMTAGAAVADVDGDGDLDIYLTRIGLPNRLLLNDGHGRFSDATEAAGVAGADPAHGSSAAAFLDVDADGDLDLVVTGAGTNGTTLYLNRGDGSFTDATAGSGLDDLPAVPDGAQAQMHGISFADYDRDGRLDLLLTHWDSATLAALSNPAIDQLQPDEHGSIVCARARWLAEQGWPRDPSLPENRGRLYRNEGGGRFRDVSAEVGLPFAQVLGFTGTFADVDGDGWDDLLLTGDFCTSRIFRNVSGTHFEDVTATARVATDENGMGSVVSDIDGDGDPDWFVTSIGPVGDEEKAPIQLGGFGSSGNRLYLNDGTGTFTDATDRFGLRDGGWGWGAAIEDLTNDGRLSVVMTNGYSTGDEERSGDEGRPSGTPADDPLRLWVPEKGTSTEVSSAAGLRDRGLGRALVAFDMDRDGDLDLLVANFGAAPRLYRNDTPRRHWLTVQLDDPGTPGNRRGVGAKVVVHAGGGQQARWVIGGGSYESQVPTEVHVGLGDGRRVERVEVWWPGAQAPQVLEDVDADQVLVIRRDAPR